ncbi:MAG: UvrB/UvrC motif-containing protein [Phycisphaerales bacterium]|jgi:protein arginine kinase activator|nr:UvrB/UvrC motif-containing protein [Phycisphaerales bacterium]
MMCECGEHEAVIHETVIVNGVHTERHLCESCARRAGLLGGSGTLTPAGAIAAAVASHASTTTTARASAPAGVCPSCGTTFAEFKQHGLLGCAGCYAAFSRQLGPLLERAHEGGTHHVGKAPTHAIDAEKRQHAEDRRRERAVRQEKLESLRRDLDRAVREEHYEKAASIRDELRRMQSGDANEPSAGGGRDA